MDLRRSLIVNPLWLFFAGYAGIIIGTGLPTLFQ